MNIPHAKERNVVGIQITDDDAFMDVLKNLLEIEIELCNLPKMNKQVRSPNSSCAFGLKVVIQDMQNTWTASTPQRSVLESILIQWLLR